MTAAPTAVSPDSSDRLSRAIERLELAVPLPSEHLAQDEEWVVARVGREWRRIRLHDYGDVFAVPGLYEKWIYRVLRCASPARIRDLMQQALRKSGRSAGSLTVLDLGAGNGCVAEALRAIGIRRFVGVDICPEAATAAERDRPGLYQAYVVTDLTDPDADAMQRLTAVRCNALTCVAALGFSDIPPAVFSTAFNLVEDGGLIAFTIKTDFLDEADQTGFSVLIRRLLTEKRLSVQCQERYVHRRTIDGRLLEYEAFVGTKHGGIPGAWLTS